MITNIKKLKKESKGLKTTSYITEDYKNVIDEQGTDTAMQIAKNKVRFKGPVDTSEKYTIDGSETILDKDGLQTNKEMILQSNYGAGGKIKLVPYEGYTSVEFDLINSRGYFYYFGTSNYWYYILGSDGSVDIKTEDASGTGGYIRLQPDGDLWLDPATNKVRCLDADVFIEPTYKLYLDDSSGSGHTYITESSDDVVDIYVGGVLKQRIAEGGTSVFYGDLRALAEGGGTYTSTSNASFQTKAQINSNSHGAIIGATEVYSGSDLSDMKFYQTTSSMAVIGVNFDSADHYCKIAFTVPTSNRVKISVHLPFVINPDGTFSLGLATDTSNTSLGAKYENVVWDVDETDDVSINYSWYINGTDHSWSAGESKTLYVMAKESVTGSRIFVGGSYGAWKVEAIALPDTIGDGT